MRAGPEAQRFRGTRGCQAARLRPFTGRILAALPQAEPFPFLVYS